MSASTIDVLILIPLIPALPILITWWLPWEKWLHWDELPKGPLGLYYLYGAFAAWHFKWPNWVVLLLVVAGAIYLAIAVHEKVTNRQRGNSASSS